MKFTFNKKKLFLIAISFLITFLVYFFLPADCPEAARRTAFVFVIAAFFWAFEIIPLFATSLLVVLLLIFLLCKPGGVLQMDTSGFTVFLRPFASPVIILFFGGFILAKSLQKHQVSQWVAWHLLKRLTHSHYLILLGLMSVTAFLAFWISKTATTAVMLSMIAPVYLNLPKEDPFRKALVLAVAFAANIGGVATPIGTPPNAIAVGMLLEKGIRVNFLSWMMMGLPLTVILLAMMSVVLFFAFKPQSQSISLEVLSHSQVTTQTKIVGIVSIVTIVLWLTSFWHHIPESVIALSCAGFLIVTGLCSKTDFITIEWDILVLMWGGLALGEAMELSGLARWMVSLPVFSHQGLILVVVLCLITVFLSTFMSNTATVNLMIPIALSMPGEHPVILAVIVAIASSFDLALPISTPPMAIAYGTGEVKVKDMLKVGIVFTIVANVLLLSGFRLMIGKAFGL